MLSLNMVYLTVALTFGFHNGIRITGTVEMTKNVKIRKVKAPILYACLMTGGQG
jgi:hypothetical protein